MEGPSTEGRRTHRISWTRYAVVLLLLAAVTLGLLLALDAAKTAQKGGARPPPSAPGAHGD